MKAVLISIQPKWVKKILDGEKTVEVRKTVPNLETPFKCYIYCTLSGSNELFRETLKGDVAEWNRGKWADRKGNVVAEFVCNDIRSITAYDFFVREDAEKALKGSGLTPKEAGNYAGWKIGMNRGECKPLYGWHISDLKVYANPKPITDFSVIRYIPVEYAFGTARERYTLKRPPQSWCYVEDLKNGNEA